ncbi:MAG: pyridoxine 5'-phosphate synthase [Flavobacteriales bacterium]|nr:pyridoxine 5'-phosphate synthase [Flavobacteriales bacterium]
MTRLSVNINKIGTLRNARGGNRPDLVEAAVRIQEFGADGITIHPRPDQRHIRYSDVDRLKEVIHTEYNIEGYPSEEFIALVLKTKPDQVTLVPDPPGVLTSNAGWDVKGRKDLLQDVIAQFKEAEIRTSLFMETDLDQIESAKETGADRIELYTGPYAENYSKNPENAVAPFIKAALHAQNIGLELNAGHDLDMDNLNFFVSKIPIIKEVSIGHALISDALYFGLENIVNMYKRQLLVHETEL